jgi:hypothetical protein
MNKMFMSIGFCCIFTLTGCGANQMSQRDLFDESGNTINVNDQRSDIYNANHKNTGYDFGYVRHQKKPITGNNVDHYASIDREKLADDISKISTDIPDVNDVATLVTDEEVIIAYSTDSNDRNKTADQVKKTGLSFVPRYYHVYVSDDETLIKNVESYANMSSNSRNVDSLIDKLIEKMLQSPQGLPLSDVENENGVMKNEMNPKVDRGFSPNLERVKQR